MNNVFRYLNKLVILKMYKKPCIFTEHKTTADMHIKYLLIHPRD